MNKPTCSIKVLKASEGDCFFLSFSSEEGNFNMLIDSGPVSCWKKTLQPFMDDLHSQETVIDVMLITHIDADHIGGALKLFADDKYSSMIREVWYNGLPQLITTPGAVSENMNIETKKYRTLQNIHHFSAHEANGPISITQAQALSTLLRNKSILVNRPSGGAAITSRTNSVFISNNFHIDFLLPKLDKLQKVKTRFRVELFKVASNADIDVSADSELAFEYTLLDERMQKDTIMPISKSILTTDRINEWASSECKEDSSLTNASSIAICIHFYEKKLLFLGDAISEDICESLVELSTSEERPLFFDVIKLPHHGASGNCLKLLDLIDAHYYLVSTDGVKFAHPGKETVAKIVTRPTERKRILMFNYVNPMYDLFSASHSMNQFQYDIRLCDSILEV